MNSPLLVSTVAVYVFAASMHIGGGSAKVIVRGEVPSASGHGVVPVMAAPGTVVGWNTVVAGVVTDGRGAGGRVVVVTAADQQRDAVEAPRRPPR